VNKTSYHFKQAVVSFLLTNLLLASCNIEKPNVNAGELKNSQLLIDTQVNESEEYSIINSNSEQLQSFTLRKVELTTGQQHTLNANAYEMTQLVNKPLNWIAYEGHQLYKLYYATTGELYGIIYDKGDPNLTQTLPVYIMPKIDIHNLVECNTVVRKRYLHVTLNRSATPGSILIGEASILGGGKGKNKKRDNSTSITTKQKSSLPRNVTVQTQKPSTKICSVVLPHPSKLPNVSVKYTLKNDKDKEDFKNALIAMQSPDFYNNRQNINKVLNTFMHVASFGNTLAMFRIGEICEHQNNLDLAIRWYVLSFQNGWFQNTAGAYNSHAYKKLQALIEQGHQVYERIFIYHPADITSLIDKLLRLPQLIHFYKSRVVEPYLDEEESDLKIRQLEQFNKGLNLEVESSKEESVLRTNICNLFKKGNVYEDQKKYQKAEEYYLQCQEVPAALLSLGWLHYHGYSNASGDGLDKKPNYQLAATYYKKARMPESYYNLGCMYLTGLIGKVNDKNNYSQAIKYLELAGTTKSIHALSSIFSGAYDQQPDYEKAKYYLERCNTGEAYHQLANLYLLGHIGKKTSAPNYKLTAYYCKKAIKEGSIEAAFMLGTLYMGGYIGKIDGRNNYQLAAKYFRDIINLGHTPTDKKAICLYCLGLIYKEIDIDSNHQKPNYLKAKYYLKQAALPESFYMLATLYEDGYINIKKEENKYEKALKYYVKSTSVEAKLEIIRLYQQNLIHTASKSEQKEAIQATIQEVDDSLSRLPKSPLVVLSTSKGNIYYFKGLKAYYLKDFVEASIFFQQALFYGTDEERIEELIKETEGHLEQMYDHTVGPVDTEETSKETEFVQSTTSEVIVEQDKETNSPINPDCSTSTEDTPIQEISHLSTSDCSTSTEGTSTQRMQEPSHSLAPATSSIYRKLKQKNKHSQQYIEGNKRKRKEKKKARRLTYIKANILESNPHQPIAPKENIVPTKLSFLDEKQEKEFLSFREKEENKNNIEKVLADIQLHTWKTTGSGKPEILKHSYKGYRGCISRRLNHKDRLIYKITGKGTILLLSWEGHYGYQ